MKVRSLLHTPAALPPGKQLQVPSDGIHNWSEREEREKNVYPLRRIEPCSSAAYPVALSLHWMRYPGRHFFQTWLNRHHTLLLSFRNSSIMETVTEWRCNCLTATGSLLKLNTSGKYPHIRPCNVNWSFNRKWRPMELRGVEALTLLEKLLTDVDFVISFILRPAAPYPPGRFVILISVRPQGHSTVGRISLTCSIVHLSMCRP
jgi:hypothetical protein